MSAARPWVRTAAAVALFVALALVNTWPLGVQPHALIGEHGDAFFSVWRLAWIGHQLLADPAHLFDGNIFFPEPRTLAYSDALLLPGTVLAPLQWVGVRPVVVYNLCLLATFVLNAVAAHALVHRIVGSYAAGVLAGVIFAFSPYRFEHFDHLEMQISFWIPLAMLAWHRAMERQTIRDCLVVSALVTGQILSCIYYAVFLLTWLGIVTLVWFWRSPTKGVRAVAMMLLPAAVVFAIYSIPYLGNRSRLGDRPAGQVVGYSATLKDFASAPASNRLYGWTAQVGAPERRLFPGLVAATLLIAGLWPPLDRRRAAHAVGLVVALQLALGSNGLIYEFLYEHVLPYRGLRVPARATVLILASTAVFAGYGLDRLLRRIGNQRTAGAVAAVLVGVASLEYLSSPGLREVDQRVSVWYTALRRMPDAVVFEWPVTVPWRLYEMVDVGYMYRSTWHWRPLLNGYSGFYPRSYIDLLIRMRSFPDTRSLEFLQKVGATVLVVHERHDAPGQYERVLERLARDRKLQVIGTGRDSGGRIAFFRLAAGP